VLSFNFQAWRYSPLVAMSLLSSISLMAYAYFLEIVDDKSEVKILKIRGARTDPCGPPFLRCCNQLCLYWKIG